MSIGIDQDMMDRAAVRHMRGHSISDLEAKIIASVWHDGQNSRIYMLASTGAIDNSDGRLGAELERMEMAARKIPGTLDNEVVAALRTYIAEQGTRGPQGNWSSLRW